MKTVTQSLALIIAIFAASTSFAQEQKTQEATTPPAASTAAVITGGADRIPANSRIYIAPMDGFESYLAAAFRKKGVPLLLVADREQADFEIVGISETKKAGWAKTIFGSGKSEETASISIINLKTKVIVYADSSHRSDANRGRRSTAEKLAKYLAKKIKEDEKKAARA